MKTRKTVADLRRVLAAEKADLYVIVQGDFHGSEYSGPYFRSLAYVTGFTGSAGVAVITQAEALLWTDGRYFLQAERQLQGSGIRLMREGEKDVPDLYAYIASRLKREMCIAFDGRVMSAEQGKRLEQIAANCGATLRPDLDAAAQIWNERPTLQFAPIMQHGIEFAGESAKDKVRALKEKIVASSGDVMVLSALDDIAWLLNVRGSDVPYTPLFFAHLLVAGQQLQVFVPEANAWQPGSFCAEAEIRPYEAFYEALAGLAPGSKVLADPSKINYLAWKSISPGSEICEISNADFVPKHIKNDTEIENIKQAHLQDGIAVTKFICELKRRIGAGEPITEPDAAERLEALRSAREGYIGPSFAPIIAYGEHGAVVHYSFENPAPGEAPTVIKQAGFLLADTGAQYLQGTTDVTRTIAMGALSEEQKRHYTAVLKGHINLAATIFPPGITGLHLDSIARRPIWAQGLDYNHGTGHGVGYFLNVHEGPLAISRRIPAGRPAVLKKGILLSNEPGIYVEGQYGIRLENLMLSVEAVGRTSRAGSESCDFEGRNDVKSGFLAFETVTLVPFERAAILPAEMSEAEKEWLNEYHLAVREALLPHMDEEEAAWLLEATEAI